MCQSFVNIWLFSYQNIKTVWDFFMIFSVVALSRRFRTHAYVERVDPEVVILSEHTFSMASWWQQVKTNRSVQADLPFQTISFLTDSTGALFILPVCRNNRFHLLMERRTIIEQHNKIQYAIEPVTWNPLKPIWAWERKNTCL